eukprot:SAG31_NODE_1419_length_8430_cov_2.658024_7_plen_224_part_00
MQCVDNAERLATRLTDRCLFVALTTAARLEVPPTTWSLATAAAARRDAPVALVSLETSSNRSAAIFADGLQPDRTRLLAERSVLPPLLSRPDSAAVAAERCRFAMLRSGESSPWRGWWLGNAPVRVSRPPFGANWHAHQSFPRREPFHQSRGIPSRELRDPSSRGIAWAQNRMHSMWLATSSGTRLLAGSQATPARRGSHWGDCLHGRQEWHEAVGGLLGCGC